jgi:hypothetical protein
MKGYKVFNPDWTCQDFQYEVGKTFEMNKPPVICGQGFHFCKKATDCFEYYSFDPKNKVAEVEALGDVETEGNKSCTNKIHIIRELSWYEVLDLVNAGSGNSGRNNSGHMNSGDRNSGHRNSGHRNSGDRNSGDMNSGDWNSGDRNSGYRNSGYRNSGDMNSGDRNSGHMNSGHMNSGDRNSGDWNLSSNNSGCFNTERHPLYFFDNPTDMTFNEWRDSYAYYLLNKIDFIDWVHIDDMTEEEKKEHPEAETTKGYLKQYDLKESANRWWDSLSDDSRQVIKDIPNFDAEKFYKITGVKVE